QGSHVARAARRRRQENTVQGRTRRRQVRLTVAEDEALAARAAAEGVSVPRLLLEQGLAEDVGVTLEERRQWLAQLFAVERPVASMVVRARQSTDRLGVEEAAPMGELAEHAATVMHRTGAAVEAVAAWNSGAAHDRS